jgi:hypothetical protein
VCRNTDCASIVDSNPIQCSACHQAKYCSKKCFESHKKDHKEECPAAKKTRKVEATPNLAMEKLGIGGWKDFLSQSTGNDSGDFWKCDCCLTGIMTETIATIHCNSKGHKAAAVKKLHSSGKTFLQYDGTSWRCTLCSTGPMADVTQEKHLKHTSHTSKEKVWLKVDRE